VKHLTNSTCQFDIESVFDLYQLETALTFDQLCNLRTVLSAASKLPNFSKGEREAALQMLSNIDALLEQPS